MPAVRVNRRGAERLQSGHVWVYSSDLLSSSKAEAGDTVRVLSHNDRPLGVAHFSNSSQIALRLLSRRVEPVHREFLASRLRAALDYRERYVRGSHAYRLVHAEGDFLPGLIVDRYGDYLVCQAVDQGMDRLVPEITAALAELLSPKGIYARNDLPSRAKEQLSQESALLFGEVPDRVPVEINGLALEVDIRGGQKTGIFLDQRENYSAVEQLARGRALDCFTGTGGFGLHLARRCDSVEAVDSSAASLETARANAARNHLCNIEWAQADVLNYLPGLVSARRTFDLVVVDPPAFTKSRSAMQGAARGYKEINLRAIRLLSPGGILVSCSCSHHMSEAELLELIAAAALDAGRTLRVLERRTQSVDHPILLTVPETHYLKCLIFEVL
jgi:23S rRNA (cytosine1962-C5)-methyltransferase